MKRLHHFFLLLSLAIPSVLFSMGANAHGLPDFTKLVENYSPAVVNISTVQKQQISKNMPQDMPFPQEGPWGDLFKRFLGEGEVPEFETTSLGSGFIISADGYILTNHHVVAESEEIVVRLSGRHEYKAKLIGSDERSDLALLKIDANNLPTVKLGDSKALKVGEWVMAIGSPFGFEHSVSVGVVSAIGRSLPNETYVPFIQTDVAINPGNSGGPLFNLKGEVIGINAQIYSQTGGFMGLSFAIPMDIALDVTEQIKKHGSVSRGWLGVLIQDVTRELAESFGMEEPRGALVAQVVPDSPAEKAGLKVGDVIIKFNEKELAYSSDLPPMVGRTHIGDAANLTLIRNGKTISRKVVIGKLPDVVASAEKHGAEKDSDNPLNIVVRDLNDEIRSSLGFEGDGVVVEAIKRGAALKAGMRRGDIIVSLNGSQIKNVGDFNRIASKLPSGRSIPVLVQRRGGPVFLALKLDD